MSKLPTPAVIGGSKLLRGVNVTVTVKTELQLC